MRALGLQPQTGLRGQGTPPRQAAWPAPRRPRRIGQPADLRASARGKTHDADFRINEPEHAYLAPAKLLVITAIDLLYGDAEPAKQILADFKPAMSKDE
jgi:hypothetical protein